MNLAIIEEYDSLGYVLARRQILTTDTITSYHNNREYLYKNRRNDYFTSYHSYFHTHSWAVETRTFQRRMRGGAYRSDET